MSDRFNSEFALGRRDLLKGMAATAAVASLAPAFGKTLPVQQQASIRESYGMELGPAYPASWIETDLRYVWNQTPEKRQDVYFRRFVSFRRKPRRAILSVLNDARFSLWINGVSVREIPKGASWRLASTYDVTRLMREGKNSICIHSESLNTDYHSQPLTPLSGVAVRLETFDGVNLEALQTDTSWSVRVAPPDAAWKDSDASDDGWEAATPVAFANQAPWINLKNWPMVLPDPESGTLRILPVKPTEIRAIPGTPAPQVHSSSSVSFVVERSKTAPWYESSTLPLEDRLALARQTLPGVMVDFGREIHGRVRIRSGSSEGMSILIAFGESPGEAWNAPHVGITDLFVPAHGEAASLATGFRYALIHAVPLGADDGHAANLKLDAISCDLIHEPLEYKAALTSSDGMLQKLWDTGAYTVHLCAQRELWDAPKRDRNAYGGDLLPIVSTVATVFGRPDVVNKTLDVLSAGIWNRKSGTIIRHINGICGYSAAWIYSLAQNYEATGDKAYISNRLTFLIALLRYMETDIGNDHLFINRNRQWCFTDWSVGLRESGQQPNSDRWMTTDQQMATHFFFLGAFRQAARLLKATGAAENELASAYYDHLADEMTKAASAAWWDQTLASFGSRIQVNAMAIFSGAVEGTAAVHIADTVLLRSPALSNYDPQTDSDIVTPYYRYYILEALAMAGRRTQAAASMKTFYGEMFRRGATTFWEKFDPREVASAPIPGYGPDWRGDDSNGGTLYEDSLCHGWSSAPTPWITRYLVGIRATVAGFAQASIEPELNGATWIEGSAATPHGILQARHSSIQGRWRSDITLPAGITALAGVPISTADRGYIQLNGKPAELVKRNEQYAYVRLTGPGHFAITVRRSA
jgi:alpha-L-rhamnosidase